MEVLSSVCIVFLFYCTEWLGIRQCFAVPVPTLTNYHSYSKNNWNYRQSRYPETTYEKFVFPNKQQDYVPIVADRSRFGSDSSGKIFFPDEMPSSTNDRNYQHTDSEVFPVWKSQHRPSTAVFSSNNKQPSSYEPKQTESFEDGSIRMEMQPVLTAKLNLSIQGSSRSQSPSGSDRQAAEKKRVQEAIQEFYKWLKLRRSREKTQQKETVKCASNTGSSNTTGVSVSSESTKPDSFISDQSLVAGLKDQKCPEGQIRLENGECRVRVVI